MFNLIGKALAAEVPTITQLPKDTGFGTYFSQILGIILYVAGGLAVFYLIYGGIMYVTAGGDQEKATQARTAIVNAIIGIIIIALALTIVTWTNNAAIKATGAGI